MPFRISIPLILILLLLSLISCISPKVYGDVLSKNKLLEKEKKDQVIHLQRLETANNNLENQLKINLKKNQELKDKTLELEKTNKKLSHDFKTLKTSYNLLEQNRSDAILSITRKNRALMTMIEEKQKSLSEEDKRLSKLNNTLSQQKQSINTIHRFIKENESIIQGLIKTFKTKMSHYKDLVISYNIVGSRLVIMIKSYILFTNKDLALSEHGKEILSQFGNELKKHKELFMTVEVHTDKPKDKAKTDKDILFTSKRATVIKTYFSNHSFLNAEQIMAVGKGNLFPLESNQTTEDRLNNRRIYLKISRDFNSITK